MQDLVPVIVQEAKTMEILMLAYANAEALELTRVTGFAHFYSRSRGRIWKKGEESGNTMKVVKIIEDCDGDALIYLVDFPPEKVACHTGNRSCFSKVVFSAQVERDFARCGEPVGVEFVEYLKKLVDERKRLRPKGSYTTRLFEAGLGRILKKLGEESVEVLVAASVEENGRLISEIADLIYHLTVLMSYKEVEWCDVVSELRRRHGGARGEERC